MNQITDQFGRPYAKKKKPDRNIIATAPILESSREYVASGLTPESLARLFIAADSGHMNSQAELFDQMEERDSHLLGEISKRKNVITNVKFQLEPYSESARDLEISDFCQDWFNSQTDWPNNQVAFQDAVGKGYSALSLKWDASEGQALPSNLEFIEQKRFIFTDKTGYLKRYPRLLTDDDMMGEEIKPWSLALHTYGGKSGHPVKSSLYRVCSWLYLFKNYELKDWVIFSEIYGFIFDRRGCCNRAAIQKICQFNIYFRTGGRGTGLSLCQT